jgi:hypothetical protein
MAKMSVSKPSDDELTGLGVSDWPTWSCGVSTFDWHYDQQEVCYIVEGDVTVTAAGEQITFGPGDLVTFPAGLDSTWNVRSPVKKHYRLG